MMMIMTMIMITIMMTMMMMTEPFLMFPVTVTNGYKAYYVAVSPIPTSALSAWSVSGTNSVGRLPLWINSVVKGAGPENKQGGWISLFESTEMSGGWVGPKNKQGGWISLFESTEISGGWVGPKNKQSLGRFQLRSTTWLPATRCGHTSLFSLGKFDHIHTWAGAGTLERKTAMNMCNMHNAHTYIRPCTYMIYPIQTPGPKCASIHISIHPG